jgi:hypothetical protein
MKKLLLSSIIMFGVCGFVTAQSATDSKLRQASTKPTTTTAATPTPQKSAVVSDQRPVAINADGTAAPASDLATPTKTRAVQTTNAKVSQTDADLAKKKEIEEAKATAPATKKSN